MFSFDCSSFLPLIKIVGVAVFVSVVVVIVVFAVLIKVNPFGCFNGAYEDSEDGDE